MDTIPYRYKVHSWIIGILETQQGYYDYYKSLSCYKTTKSCILWKTQAITTSIQVQLHSIRRHPFSSLTFNILLWSLYYNATYTKKDLTITIAKWLCWPRLKVNKVSTNENISNVLTKLINSSEFGPEFYTSFYKKSWAKFNDSLTLNFVKPIQNDTSQ